MGAPIVQMMAGRAAPHIVKAIPRLRPTFGAPLQAYIMRSTNKTIPPSTTPARPLRGRNDHMYATIRNHHIVAHLGPFRTATQRVFFSERVRAYGSWIFRVLAKRAILYVVILGVIASGMSSEEEDVEKSQANYEEAEKRAQVMEDQQRREYEVWLARVGRYDQRIKGLSSVDEGQGV